MNIAKTSILLFIALTFVACATSSTYGLKYDYDKQINFTELKTYNWINPPKNSTLNPLVLQRIKNAVDSELNAKGIKMSANKPDFFIAAHGGRKDKVQVTDWGYGYSSRGTQGIYGSYGASGAFNNRGRGPSITTYNYEEGTLILDFVDPKSKNLIWRGVVNAEVQNINTPEKSENLINEAVKKVFSNYPPPKAK